MPRLECPSVSTETSRNLTWYPYSPALKPALLALCDDVGAQNKAKGACFHFHVRLSVLLLHNSVQVLLCITLLFAVAIASVIITTICYSWCCF